MLPSLSGTTDGDSSQAATWPIASSALLGGS
jgi:hypothetical protein